MATIAGMTPRSSYSARINPVFDHIDANLAEPLDLQRLADIANFSPFHFHRLFRALTGETLAERVRRRRLEVAASRLLAAPGRAASAIAHDVGFASAEVFTRAFRARFGVTPTDWRRGAWRDWADAHQHQLREIHQAERDAQSAVAESFRRHAHLWPMGGADAQPTAAMDVTLKSLPAMRVAYLRHVGPYGTSGIPRTWVRLVAWCATRGLLQPRPTMVGIAHDHPDVTPPDKCRYDACVQVDAAFRPEGELGVQSLPGGRYACVRYTGTSAQIHDAWSRFVSQWLPDSGCVPDDRSCLEVYPPDFTMNAKTGAFSCWLCMPVRAM